MVGSVIARVVLVFVLVTMVRGTWLICGQNGPGFGVIYRLSTAGAWELRSNGTIFSQSCRGVAFSPPKALWMAVGGAGSAVALSVDDGFSWFGGSGIPLTQANGVAWGLSRFVVVGQGPAFSVAVSDDGTSWLGYAGFTSGYGVAYNNNVTSPRWVVAGLGTVTLRFSDSTTSWTASSGGFTSSASGVAYGQGVWVASGVGNGVLARSVDGALSWTFVGGTIFNTGLCIAYGNGRFIAGGDGGATLAASSDRGATFVAIASGVFPNYVYNVAFGGSWIAVGGDAITTATSSDGINFSAVTVFTGTSKLGLGAAYANTTGIAFTTVGTTVSTFPGSTTAPVSSTTTPAPSTADPNSPCGSLPSCTCSGSVCTSTVPVTNNRTLMVSTSSTLTVLGSVTLTAASVLVATVAEAPTSTPLTSSTGAATVGGALQLVVGAVPSGTVTLLRAAGGVTGNFSSVIVSSSSPCSAAVAGAPSYSATTITMTLQTTNLCTGLSTGAVVGIAVGGAVGAVLIVVAVLMVARASRNRSDASGNRRIQMAAVQHLNQT